MVKTLIGDMFESKAQTLVNTVNCVGVMGKGIALEFQKRFPDAYRDYAVRCENEQVHLGRPYLYKSLSHPWILNFPTKLHWRMVTKLADISRGLEYLLEHYREWGIESLAVPPLGCGQGQLEWRVVGPTLYRYLSRMDIPVELYAPYGTPHEELHAQFLNSRPMPQARFVRPAWVALIEILHRIEQEPYHWPIGRIAFQKIAYVATEEGLPTGLDYKPGSFGPFAPGMKKVETTLVNNGLIKEIPVGRMFAVKVGPTFEDARRAYASDLERWNEKIERITDLFVRMNTQQAELTATVLFAARMLLAGAKTNSVSERDVFDHIMDWKRRRKPPLDPADLAVTIRDLGSLGWLHVKPSEDLPLPEEMLISTGD